MKPVIYLSITVFASIITLGLSGSAQVTLGPIMSEDDEPKPQFKRTLSNYKLKPKKLGSSASSSSTVQHQRPGAHLEFVPEQDRHRFRPNEGSELRSMTNVPKLSQNSNKLNPNPAAAHGRSFRPIPQEQRPIAIGRSHPRVQTTTVKTQKDQPLSRTFVAQTQKPTGRSQMSPNRTQNDRIAPVTQRSAAEIQNNRMNARSQVLQAQAQTHNMQKTRFIPMHIGQLSSGYPYFPNNATKVVKSRSLANTKTHKAKFKNMGRATIDDTAAGGIADKAPWTGMPGGKWNTMAPLRTEEDKTGDSGPGNVGTGEPEPNGQGEGGQDMDGAILDISLPLAENLCALQDGLDTAGFPGRRSNDVEKFRVRSGTPCHVFKWTSCPTNGPEGRPCGWFVLKPC